MCVLIDDFNESKNMLQSLVQSILILAISSLLSDINVAISFLAIEMFSPYLML